MILHRFFAVVVFICFTLTAGAQSGDHRYVIAPILFSESGRYVNDQFTPHVLSGIVLKRCAEKVNYRIAAEYTRAKRIHKGTPGRYDMPDYTSHEQRVLLRAGMEKGIKIGQHMRIYGVLDLAAAYTRTLEVEKGGITGGVYEYIDRTFSTGLMPALGMEVSLYPRISLAAETRAGLLLSVGLNKNIYGNVSALHYITNRLGGFMLNIHL